METLTFVPVTSTYSHCNGKKLYTYFQTSLYDKIKNYFSGPHDQRVLLLAHSDVVNNIGIPCKKFPQRMDSLKLCQDVWAQKGAMFSGFACTQYGPDLRPGMHAYLYDVMRCLQIHNLIVVVVYGDQLAIHHFDDAFMHWFHENHKEKA